MPRRQESRAGRVAASPIRCLVLDVDGVLTDGRLYYDEDGRSQRVFHVQDGIAIEWFQSLGGVLAILSGKSSPAVAIRAAHLGIRHVIQGSRDKLADLKGLLSQASVAPEETAFMGDDLPDLPAMRACGLAIAPANAVEPVRSAAGLVTRRPGGEGAVREALEHLMRLNGDWDVILQRYGQTGETADGGKRG